MSLIIDADGEYLQATGGAFSPASFTEATFGIWVKRDSASSTYDAYAAMMNSLAAELTGFALAHDGAFADGLVWAAGAGRRANGKGSTGSTAWQLLVFTYKQGGDVRVYTGITGGSLTNQTFDGNNTTDYFTTPMTQVRIGGGADSMSGWTSRCRLAHSFFYTKELTATEVGELFNGGTAGAGKNPQAVQNANLTFYAPLTSDATVTVGGVSLSATGTLTYDGADNPNVEAYGSTQNVTVANVTQANSVSGAAIYQATANGTLTTAPLKNNSRTLLANISGWTVDVKNATTNALVVRVTGLTTSALGVLTVTDPLIVTGTDYAFEPSHATYGRILPVLTAT